VSRVKWVSLVSQVGLDNLDLVDSQAFREELDFQDRRVIVDPLDPVEDLDPGDRLVSLEMLDQLAGKAALEILELKVFNVVGITCKHRVMIVIMIAR